MANYKAPAKYWKLTTSTLPTFSHEATGNQTLNSSHHSGEGLVCESLGHCGHSE